MIDTGKALKLAQAFYRHRQRKIEKHEANPRYAAPDERWGEIAPTISSLAHTVETRKKCPDEVFKRMWDAGVSMKDIAAECGYSAPQNVTQRRKNMGLPKRDRKKGRGPRSGWPTISLAEFHEIEIARMMKDAA